MEDIITVSAKQPLPPWCMHVYTKENLCVFLSISIVVVSTLPLYPHAKVLQYLRTDVAIGRQNTLAVVLQDISDSMYQPVQVICSAIQKSQFG